MTLIERAIHIHSKLHTIDLIEASDIDSEIPSEKTNEIIDILIADEQIKNIVLSYRKIIRAPESVEQEQD